MELYLLKKSIKGHQSQIKYLQLKLKQKAAKFFGAPDGSISADQQAIIAQIVDDIWTKL